LDEEHIPSGLSSTLWFCLLVFEHSELECGPEQSDGFLEHVAFDLFRSL
jgi:hypothetical protein